MLALRKSAGADVAHLKLHHINPSEKELGKLISRKEPAASKKLKTSA